MHPRHLSAALPGADFVFQNSTHSHPETRAHSHSHAHSHNGITQTQSNGDFYGDIPPSLPPPHPIDDSLDNVPNPVVFQCKRCKTIVGDTFDLVDIKVPSESQNH